MAHADSFIDVFMALRERISRLVMGIVPPREVEDIVQETYVRVCQLDSKKEVRNLHSYVFRTARNLALDHVKRAESRLVDGCDFIDELADSNSSRSDSTFEQVASGEEFALFCEAARELPSQCRRAFVLKKVYGYSLKEIAVEMGITEPTVESHIVSGMKRCVEIIRKKGMEPGRAGAGAQARVFRRHSSSGYKGGFR